MKAGDYEKAINLWTHQIRRSPEAFLESSLEAFLNIGLAHYWSGRYERALEEFDRARQWVKL